MAVSLMILVLQTFPLEMTVTHFAEKHVSFIVTIIKGHKRESKMKNQLFQCNGLQFAGGLHFAFDMSGQQLLFIEQKIKELLCIDGEDISVDTLQKKVHKDDLPLLKHSISRIRDGVNRAPIQFRAKSLNDYRWFRMVPLLVYSGTQSILLGNITDVTDEVTYQEMMTKYTNKKNSILYMLGHDLRGPLNIANSIIQQIGKEVSDVPVWKKIEYLSTTVQQSLKMVDNLLNREFIETANIVLFKTRINIVKKVNEYIEEYRSSYITNRIFAFYSNKDEIYIELDESKFMQVMNNLMSNALKFTHPGSTITITITEEPELVRFSFADNGIGIPNDQIPYIFDKFTSAGRIGLNHEPTTGLGLSVVKDIINWHGGKIWCRSELHKGTTFFIDVPR